MAGAHLAVQRALASRDEVEVMVQVALAARTWDLHVEESEHAHADLAARINNGIVKAFGG